MICEVKSVKAAVKWVLLLPVACALGAMSAASSGQEAGRQAASSPAPRRSPGALMDQPVEDFSLRDLTADPKDSKDPKADPKPEPGAGAGAMSISLSQFKGKKHVVLFFFSEKCGHTKRYGKRVGEFVKQNVGEEVAFLGVRSHADDTPESIRKFARSQKYQFPILDDPEGRMARYFRVQVAPTFVVIDKEGALRYFGSFDNDDGHTTPYGGASPLLADALQAVRAGEPVTIKRALPFG
jgi:peroxiredoxin